MDSLIAENAMMIRVRKRLSEMKRSFETNVNQSVNFEPLKNELGLLMYISHGRGYKRFSKILKLDLVDDMEAALKKLGNLGAKHLKSEYKSKAQGYLKELQKKTNLAFRKALIEQIESGATVKQAKRELMRQFRIRTRYVEVLFRTQSQMAYSAGKWLAEQQIDELWGYRYVTLGDHRVRPSHEQYNNVVLPKEDTFWNIYYPPNGWQCRCTAIPLYEKRRKKRPPKNPLPIDENFRFNPGKLLFD